MDALQWVPASIPSLGCEGTAGAGLFPEPAHHGVKGPQACEKQELRGCWQRRLNLEELQHLASMTQTIKAGQDSHPPVPPPPEPDTQSGPQAAAKASCPAAPRGRGGDTSFSLSQFQALRMRPRVAGLMAA